MPANSIGSWQSQGGFLTNPKLSQTLRVKAQPMMRFKQFTRSEKSIGSQAGEIVNFDKIGNLDTEYSTTPLIERSPMPETSLSVTQGQLKVQEWGIAVPFTRKLEELADYKPGNLFQEALKNHMAKTINYRAYVAFASTWCKYTATGTAGNPTARISGDNTVGTVTRNLSAYDIRTAKAFLADVANCPSRSGDEQGPDFEYVFMAPESVMQRLIADPDIRQDFQHADMGKGAAASLIRGALGVWNGVLFVKDNQALSPTVGNSTPYNGEALMFGYDPVIMKTSVVPGIVAKQPTDYGRSRGVAWYGIFEYALTWGNNADDIPTSQLTSGVVNQNARGLGIRVIHFTGTN